MLVYFFCLSYGIYFATIYQFLFSPLFLKTYNKFDERTYYKGRRPWDLYSIYFRVEATARYFAGVPLADC
jgi:hypothetical protein